MPWDDELKQLAYSVRATFGEGAFEDALKRALTTMRKAQPDDLEAPFDANAVCYEALRAELRRLLQPQ